MTKSHKIKSFQFYPLRMYIQTNTSPFHHFERAAAFITFQLSISYNSKSIQFLKHAYTYAHTHFSIRNLRYKVFTCLQPCIDEKPLKGGRSDYRSIFSGKYIFFLASKPSKRIQWETYSGKESGKRESIYIFPRFLTSPHPSISPYTKRKVISHKYYFTTFNNLFREHFLESISTGVFRVKIFGKSSYI